IEPPSEHAELRTIRIVAPYHGEPRELILRDAHVVVSGGGGDRARGDLQIRPDLHARAVEALRPDLAAGRLGPRHDEVTRAHGDVGPQLGVGRERIDLELGPRRRAEAVEPRPEDSERVPVLTHALPYDDEARRRLRRDPRSLLYAGSVRIDLELRAGW